MIDNHGQILEAIGELRALTKSTDDGVKRINGSIAKMQYDIIKNTVDIATIVAEYSSDLKRVHDFQLEQQKEKERNKTFWGKVKLNWVNYSIIGLTAGFMGLFMPLVWRWIELAMWITN